MDLLSQFKSYIKKEDLFHPKDMLLIAVSGGVDSVVLCELCRQAGYHFMIAHCNFQLRGAESDKDEMFVRKLAEKYNVECYVKKFETKKLAEERKWGIQETARNFRYSWFSELTQQLYHELSSRNEQVPVESVPGWHVYQNPVRVKLVVAQHGDDNIETLLMNFFKGTGINGLQSIAPKQDAFVWQSYRPLLFARKESLLQFAKENKLEWREDESNKTNDYTRNYFRNELIPSIKKVFPQVEENLLDNIERLRDITILYRYSIEQIKKDLVTEKGSEFHIPVLKLRKLPALTTVLYEILSQHDFHPAQIPEVIKLLESESGKYVDSETHRIFRNRNWLVIAGKKIPGSDHYLIGQKETKTHFDEKQLSFEFQSTPGKIIADENVAQVDASLIDFPILLRRWKQGDYFYPLGMNKKKKLSRFFIDKKLSLTQKEDVWVLESGKKIFWIVGQRIDDRFKITGKTKQVITFTLSIAK